MRKKPTKTHSRNYLIGKGRPPEATRWKTGQSGNPKGRPKGAKNMATLFNEALNQKLMIHENGNRRVITAKEGIVRMTINQALKGDLKAIAFVLAKEPEIARITDQTFKTITDKMSAQEAADAYFEMIREVNSKLKPR